MKAIKAIGAVFAVFFVAIPALIFWFALMLKWASKVGEWVK